MWALARVCAYETNGYNLFSEHCFVLRTFLALNFSLLNLKELSLCRSLSSCSLGRGPGVVLLEGRHEFDQGLDTLDGHGVVKGRSAAAHRPVTFQVDQVGSGGLSEELVLEVIVAADPEGNVDARSIPGLDVVHVVALRVVDVIVQEGGPLDSLGLHGRDSTLLNHVSQIEATHVDWPAGGRIVERVCSLRERVPVAKQGSVAAMAWNQVVPDNHEGQAGRADVLLRSGVNDAVLGPVDRLRAEVARHVADESLALGHLVVRELVELKALDGLVVTIVEELGLRVDVPVGWFGDRRVPVCGVVGDLVGGAVLLGFLDSALRPCARCQVVRGLLLPVTKQVVADG